MSGARLRRSKLTEANATCAVFDGADLREADLAEGQFRGASFKGADLQGARVFIAKFDDADFSGADLRGVYSCDGAKAVFLVSREMFLAEMAKKVTFDETTKFGAAPDGLNVKPLCE